MASHNGNFAAFGLYELGNEPGTISATWVWSPQDHSEICTGIASGGADSKFEGQFQVVYTDNTGKAGEPFDLIIERNRDVFRLRWERSGTLIYHGIGFLIGDKLAFGWGPV